MKISQELPQFVGIPAFFLVLGRQSAVLYAARDGTISEIEEFRLENPHYSDKEEFFAARGGGNVFRSGAVREFQKWVILRKFIKELNRKLLTADAMHHPRQIYLFAPAHFRPAIARAMSRTLRKRVVGSFDGNFHNSHPFELLKMIQGRNAKHRVVPISKEVWHILEKGAQKSGL